MASLDATMWAEGNASTCIQAATCLPLGMLPAKNVALHAMQKLLSSASP